LNANQGCGGAACLSAPTVLRFESARWALIEAALDNAHPEALARVFGDDAIPNPPAIAPAARHPFSAEKVPKWAEKLLAQADAATGADPTQRATLVAAGRILEMGRFVQRDTYRATGLYARAWLAGDASAAGAAAHAYYSVADMRNAYLWSIRCINDCDLESIAHRDDHYQLKRDVLQKLLSPQAVAQAQRAAGDRTVVELDDGMPPTLPTDTADAKGPQ